MKRYILSGLGCLLYLAVILTAGLLQHDHRVCRPLARHECQACQWEVAFVADLPVITVPILTGESVELPAPADQSVAAVTSLFVPTASRAPPLLSV